MRKNEHKFSEEDPLGNISRKVRTYSEARNAICTMHKKACNLCQYCLNNTVAVASNSKEVLINNKTNLSLKFKVSLQQKFKFKSLLQPRNLTKQKRWWSKF